MVFHDTPLYSKAFPDPCGHRLSLFFGGIPLYSLLFKGAPETFAGTEGVDFYMVFHDIPCYPTALQRPLQAPREFTFIWYSMIFHAIPRKLKALKNIWGASGGARESHTT